MPNNIAGSQLVSVLNPDGTLVGAGGGVGTVQIVDGANNNVEASVVPGPTGAGAQLVAFGSINPFVSLNAVTTNATGATIDMSVASGTVAMQVTTTGAPTTGTVTLEVSMDGVNWVSSTATVTIAAATAQYLQALSNTAVRHARATLTALAGGTAPTVTARIMWTG